MTCSTYYSTPAPALYFTVCTAVTVSYLSRRTLVSSCDINADFDLSVKYRLSGVCVCIYAQFSSVLYDPLARGGTRKYGFNTNLPLGPRELGRKTAQAGITATLVS